MRIRNKELRTRRRRKEKVIKAAEKAIREQYEGKVKSPAPKKTTAAAAAAVAPEVKKVRKPAKPKATEGATEEKPKRAPRKKAAATEE